MAEFWNPTGVSECESTGAATVSSRSSDGAVTWAVVT